MSRYSIPFISIIIILHGSCTTPDRIVFSSGRNGNSDIFLMDGSGEKLTQLTYSPNEEWAPTWMGNDEISFLRQSLGSITRYKINIRTLQETYLEHPSNCLLEDKNVLYGLESQNQLYECEDDIFLANKKGIIIGNLTEAMSGTSKYSSWANEDNSMIFTNNSTGNNDIYKLDLESAEIVNLTDHPANDERGELSSTGQDLVFSSNRFNNNQDILVLNLETGEITNITQSPGNELIARWSKNDKTIYYGGNSSGNWEIYSYDIKTGERVQLTNDPSFDGDPGIN